MASDSQQYKDGVEQWTVEQTGDERILCRWYTPEGGNLMKREVAVMCGWNGKDDQRRDETDVLAALRSHVPSSAPAAPTTETVGEELRKAAELFVDTDPFSYTIQGDDTCQWCRRDRPSVDGEWSGKVWWSDDLHNSDCEGMRVAIGVIRALSRSAPQQDSAAVGTNGQQYEEHAAPAAAEIDAQFAGMATDEKYQAEARKIASDFDCSAVPAATHHLHHVACSALPTQPIGSGGCSCIVTHLADRPSSPAPAETVRREALLLAGLAGDPIWLMADGPETHPIGVRLDCGDAGVVYLSSDQAEDLAEQLTKMVRSLQHSTAPEQERRRKE